MVGSRDKFQCFEDLAACKTEGVHYRIKVRSRPSLTAVVAPHGGAIEPCTSEIATEIAGDSLSLYLFEGLIEGDTHQELHISSSRFDEPRATRLIKVSKTVITVHGRKDDEFPLSTYVGGLDFERRDRIVVELTKNGFVAEKREPGEKLSGAGPLNICNRGTSRAGVQLEISRTVRDSLRDDAQLLRTFALAVQNGLIVQRASRA
jgi:phage replication-related protein YjqB (UPF0714/DUF867 family)